VSARFDGDGSHEDRPRTVGEPTVWDRVVVDERLHAPPLKPRLLVTNDDGIDAPGLGGLAARLAEDFEVIVVAPSSDMSGTGTALGRLDSHAGVELRRVDMDGVGMLSPSTVLPGWPWSPPGSVRSGQSRI
jgi:hypothetical protein